MMLADHKDVETPELVNQIQSQAVAKVIGEMKKPINGGISLDEWAEFASLGKHELIAAFNKLTGIPPMTFHNAEKLEIAKWLLVFERMPVTQVCYEIGFESLGSFVTKFSRSVGISPGTYAHAMRGIGFSSIFMRAVRAGKRRSESPMPALNVHLKLPPLQFPHSLIVAVFKGKESHSQSA